MIEGTLDRTVGSTLNGWAWDSSRPRERLVVDLYDHDERRLLTSVTADEPRMDLVRAGKGDGRHAFSLDLRTITSKRTFTIAVRVSGTSYLLARSPLPVELEDWEARAPRLRGRFCKVPFEKLALSNDGARLCCPSYVPKVVGDPKTQTLDEIWNSPAAIEIRRSIVDGDYRYCLDLCPVIVQDSLPTVEELAPGVWEAAVAGATAPLPTGPRHLALQHDRSCNLSCPSCRATVIAATVQERAEFQVILDRVIRPAFPSLRVLEFAGGEILASAHLKNVALSIDKQAAPDLRIAIMSNGTLFDRAAWEQLRNIHGIVKLVYVSLDAAAADSFQELRRGGIWPETLANVEFLSTLRRDGLIEEFGITFVVQQRNFREMRAFAELGLRLGCDRVMFHELVDFGTYAEGGYARRNVCDPAHPQHQELLAELRDPIFAEPCVELTALHGLRRQALLPEPVTA
jgi:sulfatase maturation enzyme AslB (radical SAM superfamily)